jgi:hypothetical protein
MTSIIKNVIGEPPRDNDKCECGRERSEHENMRTCERGCSEFVTVSGCGTKTAESEVYPNIPCPRCLTTLVWNKYEPAQAQRYQLFCSCCGVHVRVKKVEIEVACSMHFGKKSNEHPELKPAMDESNDYKRGWMDGRTHEGKRLVELAFIAWDSCSLDGGYFKDGVRSVLEWLSEQVPEAKRE